VWLRFSTQVVSLGADVHAVNEGGNKPLHVAAYEGHVAVMEALIERGT
jgi:ankyrin repeat protein